MARFSLNGLISMLLSRRPETVSENAVNVEPYAEVRSVAGYEAVSA